MKGRIRHTTLVIAAVAMLTGCATSFQGKGLEPVPGYPSVIQRKTVYVNLAFAGKLNGASWPKNDARNKAYLKQRCIEHLEASGMFSYASGNSNNADIELLVAVINEKKHSAPAQFLAGCTLFIIPHRSSDHFELLAVARERATGREARIPLKHSVSYWQQLFLLPFSLSRSSAHELDQCTDILLENLCLELYRRGMVR